MLLSVYSPQVARPSTLTSTIAHWDRGHVTKGPTTPATCWSCTSTSSEGLDAMHCIWPPVPLEDSESQEQIDAQTNQSKALAPPAVQRFGPPARFRKQNVNVLQQCLRLIAWQVGGYITREELEIAGRLSTNRICTPVYFWKGCR